MGTGFLWRMKSFGDRIEVVVANLVKVLNETVPLKPRLRHSEMVNSTLCEFQCSQQTKRKQG